MTNKQSKRLRNIRRAQERKALKKALKRASRQASSATAESSTSRPKFASVSISRITEDDLLAFQYAHFGDDSKPHNWFVDAQTALAVQHGRYEVEDLGLYPDGKQRTLTDSQIAIFRHTELQQVLRQHKRKSLNAQSLPGSLPHKEDEIEEVKRKRKPRKKKRPKENEGSIPDLSIPAGARRVRKKEVPYAERHKRKWEKYIAVEDEVQGAKTARRLARERDDLNSQAVELDYG